MASAAALASLRGEGVVEFALHPGGYIRFGDDFILVATPRSPRGPLTAGRPRASTPPRCAPATAPGSTTRLHVGPHTIPLTPTPWPRPKLGAGWRAALDVIPQLAHRRRRGSPASARASPRSATTSSRAARSCAANIKGLTL